MRFMLLFFADEDEWMALADDEREAAVRRIGAWVEQQAQAGRIVEGSRLGGMRTATTVRLGRAGRSGKPLVTDGPFIETKEAIGSYCVVAVPDRAAAIALAEGWPGGGAVEIRPIVDMEGG